MDTTSNVLSRILHLLAVHPDVQEQLRTEIINAGQTSGDFTYDQLVSLPFLDAVCRETLRLSVVSDFGCPVWLISRSQQLPSCGNDFANVCRSLAL